MIALAVVLGFPRSAHSQEIRYFCYIKIECEVISQMLAGFENENPGITVKIELVPYKAIRETLPVQLAAGTGPDMASVTDLPGLNRYYLDLSPYVDRSYWEENFSDVLGWYRVGPRDRGIYGLHTQLTLTGAYINVTLFEQAGVRPPGPGATWDEWVRTTRQVASRTQTPFPMAMDRSGHRISGPAISNGAKIFDDRGKVVLDDEGFRSFVAKFARWNNDGTFAKQIWAVGGASYKDARREFVNADVVFYFSGSWQVGPFDEAIGDAFDWKVVGNPCGKGGCTGMPGGTGLVGFKHTKHPEAVARFIDYFARPENYEHVIARTQSIPAHRGIASRHVDYPDTSPRAAAALRAWTEEIKSLSPIASRLQGFPQNRAVFDIAVRRVTQIIVGELSLDQGMSRINRDLVKISLGMESAIARSPSDDR